MHNSLKAWHDSGMEDFRQTEYLCEGGFYRGACFSSQWAIEKLNIKVSVFIDGHNDIGSVFEHKSPGFYGFVDLYLAGGKNHFQELL